MSQCLELDRCGVTEERAAWSAVLSLSLGVFGLVTAELLPASLLTPMASGLGISEALAGQAVSATAIVGFFAALLCGTATRGMDRRHVLMGFSGMLIASNLLVAIAPNLILLMLARALLGVALGGFWSMATATAIRLVPPAMISRALSLMFSGLSAAAVVAIPLGSSLGALFGWRYVFVLAAGLGVATLLFQMTTLPRLPHVASTRPGVLLHVLQRRGVAFGVFSILAVFSAHFGLFTYVRPFLEGATGAGANAVAATLLSFGVANFGGTLLAGPMIGRNLRLTLGAMPLVIGLVILGLAEFHAGIGAMVVLVGIWGLAYGAVPVAWSTWMATVVPDETESGGGIMVAAVQLAITLGAAGGGVIDASTGVAGVFVIGGGLMLAAAGLVFSFVRVTPSHPQTPSRRRSRPSAAEGEQAEMSVDTGASARRAPDTSR